MIGTKVGTYEIVNTIGKGGMGQVYLARHTLLGRSAAVKVLLPAFSQDQDTVNRFFNEARAATAVRHPGIVEIYDFGFHTDGSAYIVMELLEGESLATRMERGRMPIGNALAIVRQITGVLAAAHGKGIVHRDLKPDNIFLVPDPEMPAGERVKLLDFGIAKLTHDQGSAQLTRAGAVMGTPAYMAPEQCRGVHVDHRADLYSLGCILFELITGRSPFIGEGVGDILAAHIYVPAPRPVTLVPDVPASTQELTLRLLEKDPAARPQRVEEVTEAIDSATDIAPTFRSGTDLRPSTLRPQAITQPPAPGRSRTRAMLAIVGVLGAAVVAAIALLSGGSSATTSTPAAPSPHAAIDAAIAASPPATEDAAPAPTDAGVDAPDLPVDAAAPERNTRPSRKPPRPTPPTGSGSGSGSGAGTTGAINPF